MYTYIHTNPLRQGSACSPAEAGTPCKGSHAERVKHVPSYVHLGSQPAGTPPPLHPPEGQFLCMYLDTHLHMCLYICHTCTDDMQQRGKYREHSKCVLYPFYTTHIHMCPKEDI